MVSAVPGLGSAFSADTKEHTTDELLVVMTPHITSGQNYQRFLPVHPDQRSEVSKNKFKNKYQTFQPKLANRRELNDRAPAKAYPN